jgi:hypothetical protein
MNVYFVASQLLNTEDLLMSDGCDAIIDTGEPFSRLLYAVDITRKLFTSKKLQRRSDFVLSGQR